MSYQSTSISVQKDEITIFSPLNCLMCSVKPITIIWLHLEFSFLSLLPGNHVTCVPKQIQSDIGQNPPVWKPGKKYVKTWTSPSFRIHTIKIQFPLPRSALVSTAFTAVRYQSTADPSYVNSTSQIVICIQSLPHLILTTALGGRLDRVIELI